MNAVSRPVGTCALQLILLACCAFWTGSTLADSPYSHTGVVFNDGGTHNVTGSSISGGPGGSVSSVNTLTGIELDNGVLNYFGNNVAGGSAANDSGANYLNGIQVGGGTANIYSGNITGGTATNNSFVNYFSGLHVISGTVNVYGGNIMGGTSVGGSAFNYLYALEVDGGRLNLHGGSITAGTANGVPGPNFFYGIFAGGVNGVVNVFGTDFNRPYGPISATSGLLTGTLEDGTPLNFNFSQAFPNEIVLVAVPEPGVAAFSALGLFSLFGVVRRCSRASDSIDKNASPMLKAR